MTTDYTERNHQATAKYHTVYGGSRIFMSVGSARQKTVWAGKFCSKWELDTLFKSQLTQDSIHPLTGDIKQWG